MKFPSSDTKPSPAEMAEAEEMKDLFLKNARTFRDYTALTPESMEVIYSLAYNQYNAGKYEDSEKVFRLLATLDHLEPKYWKGLAAAREALGQHDPALQAYGYLGMMNVNDPYPAFKAAQCFLHLERPKEAESALIAAVFNSADKPEHAELHEQAKGLLEIIRKSAAPEAAGGVAATSTNSAS
jgi:tetratricopeptide (TPR) repeat protein